MYPYDFKIFDESHLLVVVQRIADGQETELVLGADYTVSGVEDTNGGSITLTDDGQAWITASKLSSNYKISIVRDMPVTQNDDIRNQGDFYPEVHEDAFDKMVMLVQQMKDMLDRSLKVRTSDFTDSLELPTAADRAGRFLAFDSNGAPIATSDVIATGVVPVTAYTTTLLAAATAQAARILLGFTGSGGSVPTALIEDLAVTAAKLGALAVTTAKIDALAVTAAKLAADAVTTAKILDGAVTKAKLDAGAKFLTIASCSTTHSVAATTEFLRAVTSTTGYAITLPVAASYVGRELTIKKMTNDFYQLTVADLAATLTTYLSTQGETLVLVADTDGWHTKDRRIPSSWVAWTPTGSWIANTTYSGMLRRVGDDIELQIKVATSGVPTTASLTVNLPSGLTVATAKLLDVTAGAASLDGFVGIKDASAGNFHGDIRYNDTGSIAIFYDSTIASVAVTQAAPMAFATGDFINIFAKIPVSGAVAAWAG